MDTIVELERIVMSKTVPKLLVLTCRALTLEQHRSITSTGQESCGSGAADLWALDDEKICIHYAKLLLRDKTKWKLEDFLEEWAMITPSWMSVDLNMLRGEALVEKVGLESWLHQFSCSLLPCRPDARFTALFSRRSKWEWEDLEPYLK